MVTMAQSSSTHTDSEFFSDGTALELARAGGSGEVNLLAYSNGSARLAPTVEHHGVTYAPTAIGTTVAQRLVLPNGIIAHASTGEHISLIKSAVHSTGVVDETNANIAAYFALASAVADLLATAPLLAVTGTVSGASLFLQVLGRCCRHSIFLAEMSARVVTAISVESIHPTLLALQVAPDQATARWLSSSSHRGFLVPCGAKLHDSFCAKALYLGEETVQPPDAVRVDLLPVLSPTTISQSELDKIAAEVQPRLLGYRLAFRAELSRGGVRLAATPTSDASRPWLPALFEKAAQTELAELLRDQVDDAATQRAMSPIAMLIECGLAVCHESKPNVRVAELAELLNVALAGRGEPQAQSRAVGAMLKSVGLTTKRLDHKGRGLVLSESVCRRIHRLARDFQVPAAATGDMRCALCPEFWG
jgi:hypothetical protein